MNLKKTTSLLLIYLGLCSYSHAQSVAQGQLNTWFMLLNQVKLTDKFTVSNELHERTGSFLSEQGQLLIRPWLDYNLNEQVAFSLGYTFINVQPYKPYSLPIARNEHNIWEQVLLKQEVGKVHFQHRFRQENRWVGRIEMAADGTARIEGNDYLNRFRYRFTTTFDLVKMKKEDQAIFFNGFDEIWLNQDRKLRPSNFARNWLYLGLGYRFDKSCNLQLGYMNQYDRLSQNRYISSPIMQLSLFKTFDLKKNQHQ